MENNMQPIEGGIISSIAKLLFGGGLDKLLGEAAEYEEEMGVLKQVTRLTVEDPKTHDRYELKIKLSPVKDKESFFYVEAECDAPNLDLSSINDKAMKIDNSNIKDFNSKIDKLLTDNGLEPRYSKSKEGQIDETVGKGNGSKDYDKETIAKMQEQVDEARKWIENNPFIGTKETGNKNFVVMIKVELSDVNDSGSFSIVETPFDITSGDEKSMDTVKSNSYDFIMNENTVSKFIINSVKNSVNTMMLDAGLKPSKGAKIAEATFIKNKNGDIELTAIHASRDIKAAMDAVYNIIEDDDFVDQLTEDAQSFAILDDGETYDIEDIEEVVVDNNYLDLFSETSRFHNVLRTYEWAIGNQKWQNDTTFSSIMWPVLSFEDSCALWVVKHDSNHYPTPQCAYTDFPSFDVLKDEEGGISLEDVKTDVIDKTKNFLDILEYYYVNLEHEEQKTVDDFINQIETILAYA